MLIQSAVENLVKSGAIHPGNLYGQFNMLEQLARDPTLIPLALTKEVFRTGAVDSQQ